MRRTLLSFCIAAIPLLASEVDDAASVCGANTVLVMRTQQINAMRASVPAQAQQGMDQALAEARKDLASAMADYTSKQKKKFDLAKCRTEEQVANLRAQAESKSPPPEDDAAIAKGYVAVTSEPEALRNYCVQNQMFKLGDQMKMLPPEQRKELAAATARGKKLMAEMKVSYEKRFKKPLNEKACAAMGL